jgi:hypothetical protein
VCVYGVCGVWCGVYVVCGGVRCGYVYVYGRAGVCACSSCTGARAWLVDGIVGLVPVHTIHTTHAPLHIRAPPHPHAPSQACSIYYPTHTPPTHMGGVWCVCVCACACVCVVVVVVVVVN